MKIHILADNPAKFLVLRGSLEPHQASASLLGKATGLPAGCDAVIVRVDLTLAGNIAALKQLMPKLAGLTHRVFVVGAKNRLAVVQALALSATHVLEHPVDRRELLTALGLLETATAPSGGGGSAQEVCAGGAQSLATMFADVQSGRLIDLGGARNAALRIADSIAEDGFSNWLETVRHHHEGTYQHCLLVTGVAVEFGLKLGLPARRRRAAELRRACCTISARPRFRSRCSTSRASSITGERVLIETHPVAGYDALKDTPGHLAEETLDAVRHHHEYLDGSGYPDGLSDASISDLVRIPDHR